MAQGQTEDDRGQAGGVRPQPQRPSTSSTVTNGLIDVYDFGRRLLETKDLDPVYVVVWHSHLEADDLKKWLLAYWCFYHVGTAGWITNQGDYWGAMRAAAGSKEYPRSSERRHFRGRQALASVNWLNGRGLDNLFRPLLGGSFKVEFILSRVQEWRGFGPWISFKVADMLERLGLAEIEFSPNAGIYDSPAEGAKRLWDMEGDGDTPEDVVPWAFSRILDRLAEVEAPPRYERGINVQEVETILCKWNSYRKGRYHVGEDVEAVKSGLLKYARVDICQNMLKAGKSGGLW